MILIYLGSPNYVNHGMPRTGPQFRSLVRDPATVRDILRPLIELAGSQRAAAQASRISQPQLSRMMGMTKQYLISQDVVRRLLEWVPAQDRLRLEMVLMRGSEIRLSTRYENWLANKTGGIAPYRPGQRISVLPTGPAYDRRVRRERLLKEVEPYFRQLFARFGNRLSRSRAKPNETRRHLAYDRVLAPLLDGEEVEGVEMTWRECAAGAKGARGQRSKMKRLGKILEYGMQRELMLLDRPPDEMRFKAAVEGKSALQEALTQLASMLSSGWDLNPNTH
jgi:hypothetical protein